MVDEEDNITWYSKGYGEQSLALPIWLQKALFEANLEQIDISQEEQDMIITCSSGGKFTGMIPALEEGGKFSMVDSEGQSIAGVPPCQMDKLEIPPEEIKFQNPDDEPNFERELGSWTQDQPVYGQVVYRIFESKNGKYRFLFCSDSKNRAWIGAIELVEAPINQRGLKEQWVNAGVLTTPAFEYPQHAKDAKGNYYGNPLIDSGDYTDVYDRFLSRIPIIQEYVRRYPPEST